MPLTLLSTSIKLNQVVIPFLWIRISFGEFKNIGTRYTNGQVAIAGFIATFGSALYIVPDALIIPFLNWISRKKSIPRHLSAKSSHALSCHGGLADKETLLGTYIKDRYQEGLVVMSPNGTLNLPGDRTMPFDKTTLCIHSTGLLKSKDTRSTSGRYDIVTPTFLHDPNSPHVAHIRQDYPQLQQTLSTQLQSLPHDIIPNSTIPRNNHELTDPTKLTQTHDDHFRDARKQAITSPRVSHDG